MRILLTGFEPFGGSDMNSSWETATRVGMRSFEGVEVVVRQLPVSFRMVGDKISGLLEEIRPDVMVMLGQRGKGTSIDVERIAINLMYSEKGDNDGYMPDEVPIMDDAPLACSSNLPVRRLKDSLTEKGIEARVSNSAGLYVCNCAYYEALRAVELNGLEIRVVFVHVPKISDDNDLKNCTDAISILIETIKTII